MWHVCSHAIWERDCHVGVWLKVISPRPFTHSFITKIHQLFSGLMAPPVLLRLDDHVSTKWCSSFRMASGVVRLGCGDNEVGVIHTYFPEKINHGATNWQNYLWFKSFAPVTIHQTSHEHYRITSFSALIELHQLDWMEHCQYRAHGSHNSQ